MAVAQRDLNPLNKAGNPQNNEIYRKMELGGGFIPLLKGTQTRKKMEPWLRPPVPQNKALRPIPDMLIDCTVVYCILHP